MSMHPAALLFAVAGTFAVAAPVVAQPVPVSTRPRPVQVMTLESPAWADGGLIPATHTQAGGDVSPPLEWRGAPEGTRTFVLVVRDLDAVAPGGGDDLLHWLVWNIPGTATALPAGVPAGNAPEPTRGPGPSPRPSGPGPSPRPSTDDRRQISATGPEYRGPAAPASGPLHHYVFELYALDSAIDVPAVGQSPAATRAAVMAAMAGHVRGKGVLTGRYRRATP